MSFGEFAENAEWSVEGFAEGKKDGNFVFLNLVCCISCAYKSFHIVVEIYDNLHELFILFNSEVFL